MSYGDIFSIAQKINQAIRRIGLDAQRLLPPPEPTPDYYQRYRQAVKDHELRQATEALFRDGFYTQAVTEAYKCLNNTIKRRVKSNQDGSALMKDSFSLHSPKLKLSELRTQSQRDQQLGYMEIFSGSMTGIRNPRAHEHRLTDTPEEALEMLCWANHLMNKARAARRTRKKSKP